MLRGSELFDVNAAFNKAVADANIVRDKLDAAAELHIIDDGAYRVLIKNPGAVEEIEYARDIAQKSSDAMHALIVESIKADRLVKELQRLRGGGGRTKRRRTKRRRTKRRRTKRR